MSEVGHNSDGQTKAFFERMKKLEIERREIVEDQKELAKEIKSAGDDPKAIRAHVLESLETESQRAKREQYEAAVEMYRKALGRG